MNFISARKLRRVLFNKARELDFSGVRATLKFLMWRKGADTDQLSTISNFLAHHPDTVISKRLIRKGVRVATALEIKNRNVDTICLDYCLVIKPYVSESEKGLILVSFENQLEKIIDCGYLNAVQSRYHILFIPSWTGLYSSVLFKLASRSRENNPAFILPVHEHERVGVQRLGSGMLALPFNAASWVNQGFFAKEDNISRDIDCLMVANFASFKRHWLLFKALQGLPDSVSAVCVGVPIGSRTSECIRLEAEDYGVLDRVSIVENPNQEDLRRYFKRAKVFCAMSYREGSFIAVAEALMSGTPVVMFKNAHIGTKSLIEPENGALVGSVSELRERIMEFMSFEDHDRIRQIAGESISAQANCRKLNDMLEDWSRETGLQWTKDIEPFYSMRLSFYYFDENAKDKLRGDYQYLQDQGIKLNLP